VVVEVLVELVEDVAEIVDLGIAVVKVEALGEFGRASS
jgi:hypothetical protein